MSLHSYLAVRDITSNANLRTLFQGISNGCRKAGLVRVYGSLPAVASGAFAGASDFSAVNNPGTVSTTVATEIWRFDDALQGVDGSNPFGRLDATHTPVYIHITYGIGVSVARPTIRVSVGTALNDPVAPTSIQGQFATNNTATFASLAESSSSSHECMISGDTNRLLIATYIGNVGSSVHCVVSIERTHNADGTDNAEGIYFVRSNGDDPNGGHANIVLGNPYLAGYGGSWSTLSCVFPTSGVTAYGGDFHTTLCYPARGRLLPPSLNIALVNRTDVPNLTTLSLNYYGSAKLFICSHGPTWSNLGVSGSTAAYLLRYE